MPRNSTSTTLVHLSNDINVPLSTYFPPGELSIATEVQQLLPPLSPELGPWEPSMPDIPPIDTEVLLESTSDIAKDPTLAISQDSAQEGITQASTIPGITENPVQATEPFVVPPSRAIRRLNNQRG